MADAVENAAGAAGAAIGGVLGAAGGPVGVAAGGVAGQVAAKVAARGIAEAARYGIARGMSKYLGKKVDKGLDAVGGVLDPVLNEWKKNWEHPGEMRRAKDYADFMRAEKAKDDWDQLKKTALNKAVSKGVPMAIGALENLGRGARALAQRYLKSRTKSAPPKPRSRSRSSRSRSRSRRRREKKYGDWAERAARKHRKHRKRSKSRTSRSRSRHRRHKALRALRRELKDKETERYIRDLAHGKRRKSQYPEFSRNNRWGIDGRPVLEDRYDRYGMKRQRVVGYRPVRHRRYYADYERAPKYEAAVAGLAKENEALRRVVKDLEDRVAKVGRI